jgi:hypothetical protein
MVKEKTTNSGRIAASMAASAFLDLFEEAVINSLDESRETNRMAIKAPPTPPMMVPVNATALELVEVRVVAAAIDISKNIKSLSVVSRIAV